MSQWSAATVRNPRWWIVLPFTLLSTVILAVQMTCRLMAFALRSVDEGIEECYAVVGKPIHNWWQVEAKRRQVLDTQSQDPAAPREPA